MGAPRTILVVQMGNADLPCVSICAGVHGDEPAGPAALLSLAEDGLLDRRLAYRLLPCTNPTGLAAGTRENFEGVDVNRSFSRGGTTPEAKAILTASRDRRFALSLDLHEDLEARGFYCYEPVGQVPLAPAILGALDAAGLPVQALAPGFDLGYPDDAAGMRTLHRGLVLADYDAEANLYSGLPFSLHMRKKAAQRVLTLEGPGAGAWEDRVATLRVAVVAAIAALLAK
ncbi:MAG: hypothetical protein NVS9B12_02720 [Vulcanimicrobiaceae bacterium]